MMKNMIKYNWFFEQSPETVWKYLTTSELMAEWLMKNDFELMLGRKFMFKANPHPDLDFDGKVYCEILEIDPEKKLVYSWKSGDGLGTMNVDSIVTWILIPKNEGTELILEHSGFDELKNTMLFQAMNKGWDENVRVKMGNLFNTKLQNETTGN
jgi:uncharacterized protein YndB with AHSA1/START domain